MMNDVAEQRMVNLVASDGEMIPVTRNAIRRSNTINDLIDTLGYDDEEGPWQAIPIKDINSHILKKVVIYLEHHVHDPLLGDEAYENSRDFNASPWDQIFLDVDRETLFDLVLAANYLHIPNLYDLTSKAVAKYLENNSVEEIRRILNVQNDYAPEEEEAIRRENDWAD